MKYIEQKSDYRDCKRTRNFGKTNRWRKKVSHRSDRREMKKKDTYPGESFDDSFLDSDDDDLG